MLSTFNGFAMFLYISYYQRVRDFSYDENTPRMAFDVLVASRFVSRSWLVARGCKFDASALKV